MDPAAAIRRGLARPGITPMPPAVARPCRRLAPLKCPAKPSAAPEFLTAPLRNELTEVLSASEPAEAPLWGAWCGTVGGLWVGTVAAYGPSSGRAEALALGEDGRGKVLEMAQCCVEERSQDGARLVRHTARATSEPQLQLEMARGAGLQFEPSDGVEWDVEELQLEQDGLYLFQGGTFSAGPSVLGVRRGAAGGKRPAVDAAAEGHTSAAAGREEDLQQLQQQDDEEDEGDDGEEWAEAEEGVASGSEDDDDEEGYYEELEDLEEEFVDPQGRQIDVIEACMQYNGEQRVRVLLTLASSFDDDSGELDVDLLRVVVCREAWEGLPGQFAAASQPEAERQAQAASGARRLDAAALAGFWNEFEVSGTSIEDVDLRTGAPARFAVYTSRETQRLVAPGGEGADGGALWLPHSVAVELSMAPAAGGNGSGGSGGRDFVLSTLWSPEAGMLLGLRRRYAADGALIEVGSTSAVRAG